MKNWYESKTLWFNVVMTALDVAALAGDMQFGGESAMAYFAFIHGAGNIILRIWFTDMGIRK